MSDRLYIGIDSGTQGTKGVILSEKKGKVIAQASSFYGLIENDRGGREQEATFGLRYGLDVLKQNGIIPNEIRLVGGGAKSRVWRQLVADVFNCSVVCLANDEAGATGAALQALWCKENTLEAKSLELKDITDLYVIFDDGTRCQPSKKVSLLYDDLYKRYITFGNYLTPSYPNALS